MRAVDRRGAQLVGPGARRLVGAGVVGVAGVASALATSPVAAAAPAVATPAVAGLQPGAAPAAGVAAAPSVAPQYGQQKYRVGVQVADGSYVPDGTTTADTEITTVVTHQNGTKDAPKTCRTQAEPAEDTATYCGALTPAAASPALTTETGTATDYPFFQLFTADAGDTITITQTSVNANLVTDSETATIPPCETDAGDTCFADGTEGELATSVTFDDKGLPPLATDDTASTIVNTPVRIAVFTNDDTVVGAPVTGKAITVQPAHGTAVFSTDTEQPPASDQAAPAAAPPATTATALYTPAAGFTGVDTFRYSYSTANGTASALVTVTVTGPTASPTPTPTTSPTSSSSPTAAPTRQSSQLAQTGSDDDGLLLTGAVLLLAGGAVTVLGRRRATHRR